MTIRFNKLVRARVHAFTFRLFLADCPVSGVCGLFRCWMPSENSLYARLMYSDELLICSQFKDKNSEMMTFAGHCRQIQSLETETADRYTTVCEKCELPYKDCNCHCPVCCMPLTACHVDCRVDDEMPQNQPQAVTIIHPKTALLPTVPLVHETPRTLGTLGFSPVDVIDVEKKRAFFLTKVLRQKHI